MKQTLSFYYWPERVDGPDDERRIAKGDWRDADHLLDFTGCQVYPNDDNAGGHSEPDWSKGWKLQRGDRVVVEFTGTSRPPEFLVQAWKDQRVLYGALIARDEERHN